MKKFVLFAVALSGAVLVTQPLMAQETTTTKPLAQQKTFRVAIDAGHGGQDKGDVVGGVAAKDVNLKLALKLKTALEARGIQVVLTRSDNSYISLRDRTDLVKTSGADFMVALSTRGSSQTSPDYGVEYQRQSNPTRTGQAEQSAVNYFMLREVPVPAAMVSGDLTQLNNSQAQDRFVNAISVGIAQFARYTQK